MALYELSGIEMETAQISRRSRVERREKREERRESRQQKREERRESGKPSTVAKVSLVAVRTAFLFLVKLNALKLADKLAAAWNSDKKSIIDLWLKFGGEPDKLKKAIEKKTGAALGLTGAEIAAAIGTATPILIALAPIFKKLKIGSKEDDKEFDEAIEQGKLDLAQNPQIEKQQLNLPENLEFGKIRKTSESEPPKESFWNKKTFGIKNKIAIPAGIVGLYIGGKALKLF